jgi:peroxiredoxin
MLVCMCVAGFPAVASSAGIFQEHSAAPVAEIKMKDTEGKEFSTLELKGKPYILFFWTTWCPYCRTELESLNRNAAAYSQEGLTVIPVNVQERAEKILSFAKARKLTFRIFMDSEAELAKAYEVLGIPTYILVDSAGSLRYRGHTFPKNQYKNVLVP